MSAPRPATLVISRQPPGHSLARSALDTTLALAVFDLPVTLLLQGDGVLQLLPEQDGSALGVRSLGKLLDSLPLYDIEQVHVDAEAAARHGLLATGLPAHARLVDATGQRDLLAAHTHVLGF
ncbi:MAG: hypothetical protein CME38_14870 [Haliea sp.]|nr:hypothetical protein [Haliea sp.]